MSGTIYGQISGEWGGMRVNSDADTRSKSFAADFATIPDTIASVSAVNVTRMDGATMTDGDLSLQSTPIINPAGTIVTLWLKAGSVGGTYNVEVVVLTAGGRTIGRDTQITVSGQVS